MAITYRSVKGSALTWQELDDNFFEFDGKGAIGQTAIYPLFAPLGAELNFMAWSVDPTYPLATNLINETMSGTSVSVKFDHPNDVTFVQFETYTSVVKDELDFVFDATYSGAYATPHLNVLTPKDYHKVDNLKIQFSNLVFSSTETIVSAKNTKDLIVFVDKISAGDKVYFVNDGKNYMVTMASDAIKVRGVNDILGDGSCECVYRLGGISTVAPYEVLNDMNPAQKLIGTALPNLVTRTVYDEQSQDPAQWIWRYAVTDEKMIEISNNILNGLDGNTNHFVNPNTWTITMIVGSFGYGLSLQSTTGSWHFAYPSASGVVEFGIVYLNTDWVWALYIDGVLQSPTYNVYFYEKMSLLGFTFNNGTIQVWDIRENWTQLRLTMSSIPAPTGAFYNVARQWYSSSNNFYQNYEMLRCFNRVLTQSEMETIRPLENMSWGIDVSSFGFTNPCTQVGLVDPMFAHYEEIDLGELIPTHIEHSGGEERLCVEFSRYTWNEARDFKITIDDEGGFTPISLDADMYEVL